MTWCSKIYDIFNGWTDVEQIEHELPSTPATKSINGLPDSSILSLSDPDLRRLSTNENGTSTIRQLARSGQVLERSDSIDSTNYPSRFNRQQQQSYTNGYLNYAYSRDYQGEHACADTLFSCHQRDGYPHYQQPEEKPYGIATISNMSLNLPPYSKFIDNSNENFQQQQLSRSFSLEIPLELRRTNFTLPMIDRMSNTRYQPTMTQRIPISKQSNSDKPTRPSSITGLVNSTMMSSQTSLSNRKESLGQRISTRSSCSVPEYETSESQSRNNEQIERAIQYHIKEMFATSPGGIFPMVYRLPPNEMGIVNDRYRIEGGYGDSSQWILQTKISTNDCRTTSDNVAAMYTNSFYDQYHYNLFAIDDESNPIIMSVKPQDNNLTVIVRTKECSKWSELIENVSNPPDYVYLLRQLFPKLEVDHFETCTNFKAQQYIKTYDEKLETQKFKFGVIYQRRGQTTEEEFFNNERHGRALDEFLDIIATRVSLKNFKGYRAGLDVSEQTDSPTSYYELFDQKEIMFHVSTLLPFTHTDSTQIQRKRHIGNDIVAIVFQEENTPFHPSMIRSNFLHAFLVVQPVQLLSRICYKMMMVTRDDITPFSPVFQSNVLYARNADQLKPFILSKLINAEYAAYRCRTFSLLQERTRCSYLKTLCENLTDKTYDVLCDEQKRASHRRLSLLSNSTKKRYFSSMKKIFTRSNSTPDGPNPPSKSEMVTSEKERRKANKKALRSGKSLDIEDTPRSSVTISLPEGHDLTRETELINRHFAGRSDESLNSSGEIPSPEQRQSLHQYHQRPTQMYYGDESDEGLDSMSSADTGLSHNHHRVPYDSDDPDAYRQQLREKSHPSYTHPWHRLSGQRPATVQIYTPQIAGIHISEAATV